MQALKKHWLLIGSTLFILVSTLVWINSSNTTNNSPMENLSENTGRLPAFPGAEGFGRFAVGGRGGDVYHVTNLKDSGPGSLRYGVESASGPRTIIFGISGTIFLESTMLIDKSYLTIAGQTAPGDGITIANDEFRITASNVIVRYIRVRLGDRYDLQSAGSNRSKSAFRIHSGANIIVDHVSASWGTNESLSTSSPSYGSVDVIDSVTIQWSIVSESLDDSHHTGGPHGFGGVIRSKHESLHHNLYAHHHSRTPKIAWRSHIKADFRNNVIYNWGSNNNYDGSSAHANWVSNYYKPGPATNENVRHRIFRIDNKKDQRIASGIDETARFYIEGNYVEGFPEISTDNWAGGVEFGGDPGFYEDQNRAHVPFDYPQISYERTAKQAYEAVLAGAGASLARDAIDRRIIEEVRTGTATYGVNNRYGKGPHGIIDSQDDVGGWPELMSDEPAVDSDGDGMPDWWEQEHGLNPLNPEDRNHDGNGDGYTNLEEYLNWLANPQGRFPERHPACSR